MSLPEEKPLSDGEQPSGKPPADTPAQDSASPEAEHQHSVLSPTESETETDLETLRMANEEVEAFRRRIQEFEFTPAAIRLPEERPARAETPRRRRRSNRLLRRPDADELGERLESIARRSAPTIDFFIFAFLAGSILSIGYLLNAPAILLLGIIVAPLMAPWVGAMLAAATGEMRFLGQTLGALFTAIVIVFVIGILGGFVSRLFQPMDSTQALLHARLWWHDLLLLMFGTIALVISFIQSEEKPILASFMLAYELLLPVSAAGFGLGSGVEGIWPQAVLVFLVHLAISLIISLLVFFYMGFRPVETSGYVITGAVVVVSLAFVGGFFGLGALLNARQAAAPPPSPTPSVTPTFTLLPSPTLPPTQLATITPLPPTEPPTVTPPPTATPDFSLLPTPLPTPIYGRVQAEAGGNGALIREEPGGKAITTVLNGYLVEFLPVDPVVLNGETWVKVLIRIPSRDIEGWMLLRLIVTATPFGSP
ncbi:MAG: DUF389 domain-containing protein [Anaerolineales bacterium]|nr:DUF389 domain-containing protein [Anaerolineales bacterium]MCX7754541.1 DUF389 domain-containing protein [Anaerolineales bacterium]MDW8277242.1 DUF389 domain-containing protein [Anaerolineales bacterium]